MGRKILYQTLQDRNNPEVIRSDGPFECTTDDAWLGHGYYFWDTFNELAHWWGEAKVKIPYVICQAECDFNDIKCFDLVGNTEHMALFSSIADVIKAEGLFDEETLVSDVITYLKDVLGIFSYEAFRVIGVLSVSHRLYEQYTYRLKFTLDKNQFVDLKPPIQICLYRKNSLNIKNFDIWYPSKYLTA